MKLRTLALVALLGTLAGCSAPEPFEPEPFEPEPSAPETLGFTMKSQERTYGDCVAGTEGCTYARLDYPVLTNAPEGAVPLAEAVTTEVRDFIFAPVFEPEPPAEPDVSAEPAEPSPEETPPTNPIDELVEAFAAVKETEPRYEGSWLLERKAFVLLSTETLLSASFVERRYTGGAHGLETVHLKSFDAATGERLELDDIAEPGRCPELAALAEAHFREVREIPPETSLEQAGFTFEGGAFALTENFAVQEGGLVFYYNPYDVAPYALGPTEIELGWEELEGLVNPRFMVSR